MVDEVGTDPGRGAADRTADRSLPPHALTTARSAATATVRIAAGLPTSHDTATHPEPVTFLWAIAHRNVTRTAGAQPRRRR